MVKYRTLAATYPGVNIVDNETEAARQADILVISIKTTAIPEVIMKVKGVLAKQAVLWITRPICLMLNFGKEKR